MGLLSKAILKAETPLTRDRSKDSAAAYPVPAAKAAGCTAHHAPRGCA